MSRDDLPSNYYTRYGAQVLADTIHDYWIARGYHGIKVEAFAIPDTTAYGVRSNIGPTGFPPQS